MAETSVAPRSREQRKHDTLERLEHDVDAWVATADPSSGTPYLVPLSFLWDGESLLFATPEASATFRNVRATGQVRVGVGGTRDVVLIAGRAEVCTADEVSQVLGDAFAAKTGFDPRALSDPYAYFRVKPLRLQAWREANELSGRELMRAGAWIEG